MRSLRSPPRQSEILLAKKRYSSTPVVKRLFRETNVTVLVVLVVLVLWWRCGGVGVGAGSGDCPLNASLLFVCTGDFEKGGGVAS